jgi:TonB family protein
MVEKKSDKTFGAVGTVLFHLALLVLLFVMGIKSIPMEEEGILVNFGDSPTGSGPSEPSRNMPSAPETTPPTAQPIPASTPPSAAEPVKQRNITQDYEKTAAMTAEEKARQAAEKKRLAEVQKEYEEAQRQKRIEEEKRVAAEEAERQRLAEEQRKKEEMQRQAEAIRNATSQAFSKSNGTGTSEGETQGTGNQGYVSGDPSSDSRTGTGLGSSGNSFSLAGRSLSGTLPRPEYNLQEDGVVVVEITVDKNGAVTDAQPILKGTTTQNSYLWQKAKEAALKARFNSSASAPAYQKGTITYRFVLN